MSANTERIDRRLITLKTDAAKLPSWKIKTQKAKDKANARTQAEIEKYQKKASKKSNKKNIQEQNEIQKENNVIKVNVETHILAPSQILFNNASIFVLFKLFQFF